MVYMKWFCEYDDTYEMVWCKWRWSDVNEDDPYEMVWCKWRWSLWNGLM